jgi:type IV pilus assembly protein PilB
MEILPEVLRKIVLESGFVSKEDFEQAAKAAQDLNKPLTDVLLFRGLISEEVLGQLIAQHLQVPYIKIGNKVIPLELLQLVPEVLAKNYRAIPFKKEGNKLFVAMENPKDLEAHEVVKRKTGLQLVLHYITPPDFKKALSQYKRNIKTEFEKVIKENIEKTSGVDKKKKLEEVAEELPVIEILNTLLEYAVAEKASDLHIEIMEDKVLVRLRIDGILRDIIELPKAIQPALIARIKILSNLKIDEHRIPQDGRFRFDIGEEAISLRVSILPGFYGENAVMRLLFESARPLSLEELGLKGANLTRVTEQIKKPHGMILVTGPTGCGKTTTLYSILNMLNKSEVKICTIEDPVEYDIHRLTQIQVNPKTGLTFASGLRSLLRHDPDIMMVGEIRDKETATIAVHAALTGHLVLSTLHTNEASGALPRFMDMGIEPFLLNSTVNMVIAQRLVRHICKACIEEYMPDQQAISFFEQRFGKKISGQRFYRGAGCEECGTTGYKGRLGVFEIMVINEKLRELILAKASTDQLREEALNAGMALMIEDGLNKVASGLTTIEEVLRVAED